MDERNNDWRLQPARTVRSDRFCSRPVGMFAVIVLAVLAASFSGVPTSPGMVGLPGPIAVASQAIAQAENGQLFSDALATRRSRSDGLCARRYRRHSGWLFDTGWYRVARAIIEPYVQFFRTIPPLAIIPLAIVTMGIEETPKIFVIFLAAFLSSVVATYRGDQRRQNPH